MTTTAQVPVGVSSEVARDGGDAALGDVLPG